MHAGLDREIGRAEAQHRRADRILQDVERTRDIGAELVREMPRQVTMGVAVAADLVAGGSDTAHQRRIALGHLSEEEERRSRAVRREQLQQPLGIGRDALRRGGTGRATAVVVPVFHVDAQGVADRGRVGRHAPRR